MRGTPNPANLLPRRNGIVFDVECKLKDRYLVQEQQVAWEMLQERFRNLHTLVPCDYELVVYSIGSLSTSSINEIARFSHERITNGDEGVSFGGMPDCTLAIRKISERPIGIEGIWIPAWQNPGSATTTLHIDELGHPQYSPMLRICIYNINGHRLSQVLNSFQLARRQIGPMGAGVIFIGVDTSQVLRGDHDLYFESLGAFLAREFKPNLNTRIAAIILTGNIAYFEITHDGGWHRSLRPYRVIRNPHFPNIDCIPLPCEITQS